LKFQLSEVSAISLQFLT